MRASGFQRGISDRSIETLAHCLASGMYYNDFQIYDSTDVRLKLTGIKNDFSER